jgi:SM-20-related protein
MAGTNVTATVPSGPVAAAKARCPHRLFHNFLGTETVAALLDYVAARERDFTPAKVRNPHSGRIRVDPAARDCRRLKDFGSFKAPFCACLDRITAQALQQLGLFEPAVEPSEFEICAYGDGGHFTPHIDTFETLDRVRILSCVYYFAATPRRFGGGILRLYGFPSLSAKNGLEPQIVDIEPETDTLLVFPSWLRHEVLPVDVPSRAWVDGRFTITCWIRRTSQPAPAGPVAG